MKSSVDEVALQGIEFWSTVCDEEVDLAIEAAEVSLKFYPLQILSCVFNWAEIIHWTLRYFIIGAVQQELIIYYILWLTWSNL